MGCLKSKPRASITHSTRYCTHVCTTHYPCRAVSQRTFHWIASWKHRGRRRSGGRSSVDALRPRDEGTDVLRKEITKSPARGFFITPIKMVRAYYITFVPTPQLRTHRSCSVCRVYWFPVYTYPSSGYCATTQSVDLSIPVGWALILVDIQRIVDSFY